MATIKAIYLKPNFYNTPTTIYLIATVGDATRGFIVQEDDGDEPVPRGIDDIPVAGLQAADWLTEERQIDFQADIETLLAIEHELSR